MMKERVAADVSGLPTYGFDTKSTPWWGTVGFVAIEGTGFALAIAIYLYLLVNNPTWPMDSPPPVLWPGTLMTVVLLLSVWPNRRTAVAARRLDLRATRVWLSVMSAIGVLTLVIRALEFAYLNTRWDHTAYGSIVWVILGLHATHLATDFVDTAVLNVLMFTRHTQPRRFSDVTDNAFYWHFVVAAWLPLYFLVYWVPRL
jgi:heme/copper-type cytochrome/quinol oxidase subunit 3